MKVKRCKHGMIENQCGVCKRWEDHCWTVKKEESDRDQYRMEDKKEVMA